MCSTTPNSSPSPHYPLRCPTFAPWRSCRTASPRRVTQIALPPARVTVHALFIARWIKWMKWTFFVYNHARLRFIGVYIDFRSTLSTILHQRGNFFVICWTFLRWTFFTLFTARWTFRASNEADSVPFDVTFMWPGGYLPVLKAPLFKAPAEAPLCLVPLAVLLAPRLISRVESRGPGAGVLGYDALLAYERAEYVHLGAIPTRSTPYLLGWLEADALPLEAPSHYPREDPRQLGAELRR
jgi:hypothetical protein